MGYTVFWRLAESSRQIPDEVRETFKCVDVVVTYSVDLTAVITGKLRSSTKNYRTVGSNLRRRPFFFLYSQEIRLCSISVLTRITILAILLQFRQMTVRVTIQSQILFLLHKTHKVFSFV